MIKTPKTFEEYYEYLKQTKIIRALEMQAQEKFWKEEEQIRKEKERLQKLAARDFTPCISCPYCQIDVMPEIGVVVSLDIRKPIIDLCFSGILTNENRPISETTDINEIDIPIDFSNANPISEVIEDVIKDSEALEATSVIKKYNSGLLKISHD